LQGQGSGGVFHLVRGGVLCEHRQIRGYRATTGSCFVIQGTFSIVL
jgi:hypothetical protein